MGSNSFRVNVLSRALALAALCLVFAWGLANTSWIATPLVCGALVLLSIFELIR